MDSLSDKIIYEIMGAYEEGGISRITVSNPMRRSNIYKKIAALPITLKDGEVLQFSFYAADKVYHYNLKGDEIREKLSEIAHLGYKLWDVEDSHGSFKLLVNKKGSYKKIMEKNSKAHSVKAEPKPHNKVKNHILKEGLPLDFLIKLGVMNKEGQVFSHKQRKFKQINKFLEIVEDVAADVAVGSHILDFGCGKSYLSFALYYYLNIVLHKNVKITGLDLKKDVVAHCNELAADCAYDNLAFHCGDAADFTLLNTASKISMMVTLHACDTATDYALAFAVKNNIAVILSAPCCQHELFSQIKNETLAPFLKHGLLKERFASLLTDAIRGQLLEAFGYRVNIVEFIDAEHTAKNIMIRAVKTRGSIDYEKIEACKKLCDKFSASPMLYTLLEEGFSL